jgi:hypothetical protein
MKKRRGVAAKVAATLVLALGGFTLAAVVSGVGFASEGTTSGSTSTPTDTTTTTPTEPPPTTTTPEGEEGCTPGFWKNLKQHEVFWTDPFDPGDLVSSVFSATLGTAAGNQTLIQALENGGGGVDALLRQAVAAVLNAASPAIDYPLSVDEIVDAVNDAISSGDADAIEELKDELDAANNLGCPLGNDGSDD